ncbi:MAG: hypothetical protein ACM3KE_08720 [Hyphomicrobiales bacterium]
MQKITCAVLIVMLFLPAACVQRVLESAPADPVPSVVPRAYQEIYREIDTEIDRQLPLVPLPWGQKKTDTAFGVELLTANSNRGEALLNERIPQENALVLDQLKSLGIKSVSLSLQYPVLTRNYPRTAEFREFYRRLAEDIRKRGFLIVAEMGSAFREPELSQLAVDYRGLKRDRFNAGLREMAEAIIADIRPDFLTILSEPDTQTRNTGLPFSPSEFAAAVRHVAKDLGRPGVKFGAGAGSWTSTDYIKALAAIPELDYIDVHIYPVHYGLASDRVLKAAAVAQAKGKRLSIGEAWLYKVAGREIDYISPVKAFRRDVFSFWQPLDQNFIQLVVNLARTIDAQFCSFFWMQYFFSYVDCTSETDHLTYQQLNKLNNSTAWENIQKGILSPTGERFRQLIE